MKVVKQFKRERVASTIKGFTTIRPEIVVSNTIYNFSDNLYIRWYKTTQDYNHTLCLNNIKGEIGSYKWSYWVVVDYRFSWSVLEWVRVNGVGIDAKDTMTALKRFYAVKTVEDIDKINKLPIDGISDADIMKMAHDTLVQRLSAEDTPSLSSVIANGEFNNERTEKARKIKAFEEVFDLLNIPYKKFNGNFINTEIGGKQDAEKYYSTLW